jgi:hypothetical protein
MFIFVFIILFKNTLKKNYIWNTIKYFKKLFKYFTILGWTARSFPREMFYYFAFEQWLLILNLNILSWEKRTRSSIILTIGIYFDVS